MAIGTRSARVEATRRRIVEVAGPLFVELGYRETTMSALAKAAGVAVQTLYLSFGSKAAVLEATLAADAEDHPFGGTGLADGDGPAALLRHVEATAVEVVRRHPLDVVLRGAAAELDPAELLARARRAALAGHARAVDDLAERPGFTVHMSLQHVTESMAALLSPETYGLLVTAHGWTVQDWVEWAGRHLVADLFPGELSGSPGTLHP